MLSWKQATRVGLFALVLAGVSLALVSVSTHPSYAQASSSLADPGTITDPGSGPKPGDPDGPTGDLPPNAGSRISGTGTGTPTSSSGIVPQRRLPIWTSWKLAFKLWARYALID